MLKKFICPLTINIELYQLLIDIVSKNRTLFHFYDVTVIAQSTSYGETFDMRHRGTSTLPELSEWTLLIIAHQPAN